MITKKSLMMLIQRLGEQLVFIEERKTKKEEMMWKEIDDLRHRISDIENKIAPKCSKCGQNLPEEA